MSEQVINLERMNRSELVKKGRRLEYITIAWNTLEGLVAVVAGILAGSVALISFGFDSLIEVASGGALMWRLHADLDEERRERVEAITLKLVGGCFMVLALYVVYDAGMSLWRHEPPERSLPGIAISIAALIVMPLLSHAKRKVGRSINSGAMMADAKQTELCAYFAAITLGGLVLNALFGWWWADPVAALIMVPIIVKEGVEGLRGETCCDDGCGPAGS
jgi:divalent metal cation (Fe/Co/Zn/Cd) transporter